MKCPSDSHLFHASLLIFLVLVSGCVSTDVFGGDVVKTDVNFEEQGAKDVVVIKDIQTIPKSPLLPGQDFTLFFTLENVDEENDARDVKIDLFDPSVFKNQNKPAPTPCIGGNCLSTACSVTSVCPAVLPSEQKQIQFSLKSPEKEEIANIKLETEAHFSVDYKFSASLFFEVPVVTTQEIEERQRAAQSISISGSKVQSSGPIQMDAEIKGAPFVLAGQDANFIFTVKNRGSKGNLRNSQIGKNQMRVEFPASLFGTGSTIIPPDPFTCVLFPSPTPTPATTPAATPPLTPTPFAAPPAASVVCVNNKVEINLFKGESIPLKFTIKQTRSGSIPPFAKYPIIAKISDYVYQLRDKVGIIVQPFK